MSIDSSIIVLSVKTAFLVPFPSPEPHWSSAVSLFILLWTVKWMINRCYVFKWFIRPVMQCKTWYVVSVLFHSTMKTNFSRSDWICPLAYTIFKTFMIFIMQRSFPFFWDLCSCGVFVILNNCCEFLTSCFSILIILVNHLYLYAAFILWPTAEQPVEVNMLVMQKMG